LWVLWGIGVLAALLYLICGAAVMVRLSHRIQRDEPVSPGTNELVQPAAAPSIRIVAAALIIAGGLSALVYSAGRAACPTVEPFETIWLTGSAFFSLGIVPRPVDAGTALMLSFAGLFGTLGWTVWLRPLRSVRDALRGLPVGRIVLLYLLALLAIGGLLCALEQPRGGESIGKLSVAPDEAVVPLSREPLGPRYMRSVVAIANAATTGIASEPLAERGLRDGSKAVLAGTMLIGGILGGPGGGLTFTLLLLAFARKSASSRQIAARVLGAVAAMTIIVAIGLLLLEAQVASRYQPPPTFADALLDAGSAVGGGGLSSGLTATLTARNLISGIGLGLSQYQLGMLVLAVAMFAGRIVPLALLAHFACRRSP
jgi:Trk-type K+ transport system membrane component